MKRRTLGLLAGTGVTALLDSEMRAYAQSAPSDFATLSKTTLTPVGAERAGNAAGTIPAWTGGMTKLPAGVEWNPATEMTPDFWPDEAPLYEVNASNMAKHADNLSLGVQTLIQKQGMSLKVYPTHRTAACPQWVYDNILANSQRAQINPAGGRLGFTGGYGGIPFPVPDTSDPLVAGAQVMWNHNTRWEGSHSRSNQATWAVSDGQPVLCSGLVTAFYYPYYQQSGDLSSFNGRIYYINNRFFSPSTDAGSQIIAYYSTNPLQQPDIAWELLLGQGRVRKAPELAYDTPSPYSNGIANFDEYFGFCGALDEYDWKLIGKQEILIPYNNNKMRRTSAREAHGPKFLNPDVVRWELHRVWVVEATLHPGSRNTAVRRRMYVDEDTWTLGVAESWDGNGNIYKANITYNCVFPNLPGTVMLNYACFNLQTGDYVTMAGQWGDAPYNQSWNHNPQDPTLFDPQAMAAAASY